MSKLGATRKSPLSGQSAKSLRRGRSALQRWRSASRGEPDAERSPSLSGRAPRCDFGGASALSSPTGQPGSSAMLDDALRFSPDTRISLAWHPDTLVEGLRPFIETVHRGIQDHGDLRTAVLR